MLRAWLKLFMLLYWLGMPLLVWIFLPARWVGIAWKLLLISIGIHALETVFSLWRAKRLELPLWPWLLRTALYGSIAIVELKADETASDETMKPIIPDAVLRYACLLVALGNGLGSLGLFLFYGPAFRWLGVPLPHDIPYFLWMVGFSFNVGILAYFVFRSPERNTDMLKVGVIGKLIFAGLALDFYLSGKVHLLFLGIGLFDAWAALMFGLYLTRLTRPELREPTLSLDRAQSIGTTSQALVLYYSLTGNARNGAERVASGLRSTGYQADVVPVRVKRPSISFPFSSVWAFVSLMLHSVFRTRVELEPLEVPEGRSYDLVVVAAQTWFVGAGLPMSGLFEQDEYRQLFEKKDAVVLVICRGLWRRSQAMLYDGLHRLGANVIAIRHYTHSGKEPSRLFSLAFYLGYAKVGEPAWLRWFLQPGYGPSEADLNRMVSDGVLLGEAAQKRGA